jgi:CBS domain-containing protein
VTAAFATFAKAPPTLEDVLVAEAMHAGVVTCSPGATLAVAARIMAAHRIHAVVVADVPADVSAPIVHGVVGDRDLLAAVASGDLAGRTAGEAVAGPPPLVAPTDSLARAVALMARRRATHVVVVDPAARRPVGVLSALDVADVVARLAETA